MKHHSIEHRKTIPYSPWANRKIERFNRSLNKANQCTYTEVKKENKLASNY